MSYANIWLPINNLGASDNKNAFSVRTPRSGVRVLAYGKPCIAGAAIGTDGCPPSPKNPLRVAVRPSNRFSGYADTVSNATMWLAFGQREIFEYILFVKLDAGTLIAFYNLFA